MDKKRVALVTGVSRINGIGKAICIELAKQGIDIFFTYWRPYDKSMPWGIDDNEPAIIQDEISDLGVHCKHYEADLMNESSIELIFNKVKEYFGSVSILINNATYSTQTDIKSITSENLDNHYMVNLKAPLLLTQKFVDRYDGNAHGRIINITSGQSLSAMSNEIAYAVTKGGIETFTKTMQHELGFKNITINAVNPGLTDSGWINSGWIDQKQTEIFRKRFPRGRFGLPADAAKLVGFLVNENADWITGQIIHSEGGFIRESYEC
ncbi:SDR family oxidoreductase [Natronoflexus pectinivorans]|nr:SDR family oxidoreductase [Natronoflexus pectinivorans]